MSGPTAAPSGKALALARRREQAQRGGRAQPPSAGVRNAPLATPARPNPASRPGDGKPVAVDASAPAQMPDLYRAPLPTAAPSEATNGWDLARESRPGQSRTGAKGRPSGRVRRPGPQTFMPAPLSVTASLTEPDTLGREPSRTDEPGTSESDRLLDTICSLADAAPADDGLPASVRELRRPCPAARAARSLGAGPRGSAPERSRPWPRSGTWPASGGPTWARTAAVLRPTIGPAAGCALPRRPRSSSGPPSRVAL